MLKKTIGFVPVLVIVALVVGCSASASQSKTAADWRLAWREGKCQKDAGEAAYNACLEKENETYKRNPPPPVSSSVTVEHGKVTAGPANPPPPPSASSPQPVVPPPVPPPVAQVPAAPQQVTLQSGVVTYVPVATGPYCSTSNALTLEVSNNTDYLVEVRGANILPLNCDAPKFVPARVIRRNGVIDATWVLPPRMKARVVFLPLNGGLGQVRVDFDAFLNLGPNAPAPAIGYMAREFTVPHPRGDKNWQDVSPSFLTNYK